MILLPTRNRIERLKIFFASARETKTYTEGILLVDRKDYMKNIDGYYEIETKHILPGWRTLITDGVAMGEKLQETWNFYKDKDWVCLLNDDHVLRTVHGIERMLTHLDDTNMVSCNDGWKTKGKETLPAGATIWSGPLLRAVGYIYPQGLKHMFIDNLWMNLGLACKNWFVDMDVIVEHQHATRMDEWKDETHEKSESYFYGDAERFVRWRDGGERDEALGRIRSLQQVRARQELPHGG